MAFQSSAWADIDGGIVELDTDGGRSKRLCTGLSSSGAGGAIEPRPTLQTQWAGNQAQISPDQSLYDVSRYNSSAVDVQGSSASASNFYNLSRQHVGTVQGQAWFQDQDLPWPSSDYDSPPTLLQVVDATTPSSYHWAPDDPAVEHAASSAYDSWNPPSSASGFQPTPTSSTPQAENTRGQYHQSDSGMIPQYACHDNASGGTSGPEERMYTGNEGTSYELCLGLSLKTPPRGSLGRKAKMIHSPNRLPFGALERRIFLAQSQRLTDSQINTATLRVSSATLENIPAGHSILKLNIQGPVTTVHSVYKISNSDYMGLLDHGTAGALGQILQEYDVDFRAYIIHDRKSDSKNSGVTWGASIPIYIVAYGHSEDSERVGQKLSDSSIFLQHPQYKEDLALYKNPQYLVRPGEEFPNIDCIDADPSSSWTEPSNERDALNGNRLDSIFESAQGPENYSIVEPSPRLRTTLQPHQRMGLAMMHEKESGSLQNNDFTGLWSLTSTSNGRSWYKNNVTGSVKENPILCLGGLLADEMGLGKSLTVIALIASALDAMASQSTEECLRSSSQAEKCNRTTLIVTPKSTLHSWKEQFAKHTEFGRIQVGFYSGNKKKSTIPALLGYDVIVTTYGTLTAERSRRDKQACDEDQPLLANHWLRVVLDEAHFIRNASTKQCATVCALRARHRWCLTGTPIQNAVEDFGSLLQFLQVYPFDNSSSFTHEIADWIRRGDEKGMKRLRLLVSAICLRRTKDCLGLPPRKNEIQSVVFNSEEKQLYETCKQSTVEFIEHVFKEDGKLKSFATVIQLILRLRQVCNHGKEMLSAKTLKNIDDFMSSQGSKGGTFTLVETALCGICGRKVQNIDSLLPCMHPACSFCFEEKEMMVSKGELECSICAGTGSPRSNDDSGIDQPMAKAVKLDYNPSSKVAALIKNLLSYSEGSTHLPIKSVVFSYWTKMLDLITQALNAYNIRFERLDGKMSTPQRNKAINNFRNDPKCTVFLATIGSAGVGIDLTAACRVHLMEPQWNPMAEEQALDRVHRIGQTQSVVATRYIVSESVEEYVVSLRKKKLDLIQQSLGPNAAPKPNALRERLKSLHDFLTSSSTRAAVQ